MFIGFLGRNKMYISWQTALEYLANFGITERKLEKAVLRGIVKFVIKSGDVYVKKNSLKNLIENGT